MLHASAASDFDGSFLDGEWEDLISGVSHAFNQPNVMYSATVH